MPSPDSYSGFYWEAVFSCLRFSLPGWLRFSFARVIEGRQHKMEVWQSREQEREAKEREERFLSGYPSYFNFSLFQIFGPIFPSKLFFQCGSRRTRGKVSINHTSNCSYFLHDFNLHFFMFKFVWLNLFIETIVFIVGSGVRERKERFLSI